jgi:cytochrome c oxidase cbb3-type subunit 2
MAQNQKTGGLSHEKIETSNFLMIVLILIVLLFGGLMCMCVKVATTATRR